jgi:hypothetical protein
VIVVAAAALASATAAGASLQLGIADSGGAYFSDPHTFYPELSRLHARLLRVELRWGGPLGVARKRPADATDPADRAYDWSLYDRIDIAAAAQGIHVVFTIFGTPAWANGGGRPTRAPWRSKDLEQFAYAAAERYSGFYAPDGAAILPPVRYWTAWNEPNLPLGLTPQWRRVHGRWVIQSAVDYAHICNAVVDGVHGTLTLNEHVACGDTGPRGNNAPASSRPTVSPLAFLRAMAAAGATGFDAYAHHPYADTPDETPSTPPKSTTAVTLGNIEVLGRELTRLYGHLPIWLDEYGYQTNPPDRVLGVTPGTQARYLTQAVARVRAIPRIQMLLWFLVRDETQLGGWQSGLMSARGVAKPAFGAFARAAARR